MRGLHEGLAIALGLHQHRLAPHHTANSAARSQTGPCYARPQRQQLRRSLVIRANAPNSSSDASTASTSNSTDQVQVNSSTPVASTSAPSVPTPVAPISTSSSSSGGKTGLAGGAVAAGVALFLASRLLTGGPSIAALEQEAIPLDVALSNGKPTVVEFYASW